jgi:hypothetical protein
MHSSGTWADFPLPAHSLEPFPPPGSKKSSGSWKAKGDRNLANRIHPTVTYEYAERPLFQKLGPSR